MAKKKNNNNNNKGSDEGGKKEEKGPIPVVLKVEMHCEGCVSKIVKSVRAFEGVESVITEAASNKLTVTGKIDPSKLRDYLHLKTKKQVNLISPQPQKQDTDKNSSNKEDKKSNEKKSDSGTKPKEAPVSTAVLKLGLHCQGCMEKIYKIVHKAEGVQEMGIDKQKELVTVKGTMDVKALAETLKERLKRPVDIVPPKKEKEGGKDADNGAEGGGGKKKGGGGKGGVQDGEAAAKMEEINRMEFTVQPGFWPGFGYAGMDSGMHRIRGMYRFRGMDRDQFRVSRVICSSTMRTLMPALSCEW
ncbi:HEAVY METAL-ASSOCIATED ISOPRENYLATED PLANT PROTEIN 6 [Salix purpurea]|uniref:HEAVY METAL-ASSOCIATED ISOPRENYLATED PLANT PROTEIN 6 n=1 Tax=Salix purpurea TaxID=77065 RepID=A0A9Q0PNQ9_SALPP|nr:HEAVY METAL-ASSOCIATED ISOPRENYLATED PLANT PROTEIN 6 [Salix purpurea]